VTPVIGWTDAYGQEDQEQAGDETEHSDGQPGRTAGHEASRDQAGALTDPYATDEYGESADDHNDGACRSGLHLKPISIG
jgi:phage/plasmid primase-like uncharacterized protein